VMSMMNVVTEMSAMSMQTVMSVIL
jgi:hypothetical protein